MTDIFTKAWHSFLDWFHGTAEPAVETVADAFIAKFKTPGGAIVWNEVVAFLTTAQGQGSLTDILTSAKNIFESLVKQELDLGGHDLLQTILDALRLNVGAAQEVSVAQTGTAIPVPAPVSTTAGAPDATPAQPPASA